MMISAHTSTSQESYPHVGSNPMRLGRDDGQRAISLSDVGVAHFQDAHKAGPSSGGCGNFYTLLSLRKTDSVQSMWHKCAVVCASRTQFAWWWSVTSYSSSMNVCSFLLTNRIPACEGFYMRHRTWSHKRERKAVIEEIHITSFIDYKSHNI